jgi:putative aldouronate transport system substrate-binding protein
MRGLANLKNRIPLILVPSVLAALLVFSCNRAKPAEAGARTPAGGKTKLTALFVKHSLTRDLYEMKWLMQLEDTAGVDVEWEQISSDWDTRKPAIFASGDVPDLLFNAANDADYATYPGLFADLAPLIEKYGPNIRQMFSEQPDCRAIATQLDGAIYGTPKYQRFWPDNPARLYINKVWLDNLGLQVPADLDELCTVLAAFRDNDANGNGDRNDEIPYDWWGTDGHTTPLHFLNCWGIQTVWDNGNSGYFAERGVVKNWWNDPRYKDFIKFVNKLYKENLSNPEVLTQTRNQLIANCHGTPPYAKVGIFTAWTASSWVGNELADQYIAMPVPKVSANTNIIPTWQYMVYNYGGDRVSMAAACKNQEAAMKFIDSFYDPEASFQVLFGGISDGNVAKAADGALDVLPPPDPSMDPDAWKWISTMADSGPTFISDSLRVNRLSSDLMDLQEVNKPYLPIFARLDKKQDMLAMPFLKFTHDENNTLEMNRVNYMNIVEAKWGQWISLGGIDAEWDAYIRDLQNAGIEQNNLIIQKRYDAYIKALE